MQRTTHHFFSIPSDITVDVEFGIIWSIEGNHWYLDEIFVDMAEPSIYSTEELMPIIRDYIDINGINPLGESYEAIDHAD